MPSDDGDLILDDVEILGAFPESGAGLLPFALGAPELSVLHAVDFSAFLGVTPGPPQRRLGGACEGLG